jgi:ATP-dependent exoDNAse (exonuclease V) beta subunit
VPFGLQIDAERYATMISAARQPDGVPIEIIDGRIDLVFKGSTGWTIVDYKSDAGGSGIPPDLMSRYAGQIQLYSSVWHEITGERVVERVLLFTADGASVSV